jgi:hypothetical protein
MDRTASTPRYPARRLLAATPGLAALALAAPGLAADYPVFRQGLWEFNRTMQAQAAGAKAQSVATKRCVDPTADMKRQNDMLSKQGCTLSPVTAKGNVYTFTSECRMQGLSMRSTSVITAESDTAYTLQVSSSGSEGASQEKLVARRIGDCKP